MKAISWDRGLEFITLYNSWYWQRIQHCYMEHSFHRKQLKIRYQKRQLSRGRLLWNSTDYFGCEGMCKEFFGMSVPIRCARRGLCGTCNGGGRHAEAWGCAVGSHRTCRFQSLLPLAVIHIGLFSGFNWGIFSILLCKQTSIFLPKWFLQSGRSFVTLVVFW